MWRAIIKWAMFFIMHAKGAVKYAVLIINLFKWVKYNTEDNKKAAKCQSDFFPKHKYSLLKQTLVIQYHLKMITINFSSWLFLK